MSEFITPLIVQELGDNTWEITSTLKYRSNILSEVISIPVGFVTDFASVPRIPIAYLLAGGTAHEAAVVHDYLYQTQVTTRLIADRVLLEAMDATGIPLWRQLGMYYAVRAFGWIAWHSGRNRHKILNP